MGAFPIRSLTKFLSILTVALIMTGIASVAMAQTAPPRVTVNPPANGGGTGGTGTSSVCDPNIKAMLDAAGSAQALRDIQTIGSVIQRPPNAMEINCYTQNRETLTSANGTGTTTGGTTGGTGTTTANPNCPQMDQVWTSVQQNTQNAAGSPTTTASATFDRINLYAGATEPLSQVASNECHPGIPTGVIVGGKAEIVCPNPGCAPVPDGNSFKCAKVED